MQSKEVDNVKEREPAWFEINMLRCIYCGFCEEVCPEEAIVMSKEYDLTFTSRDEAVFDLTRLLKPKDQVQDRLDYLDQYKNQQFGQQWDFQHDNNLHSVKDQQFLDWLAEEGMDDLDSTHNREDRMATAGDQAWGPREDTPETEHKPE
jgi:NADH-quinone oxidoreductase subunit I